MKKTKTLKKYITVHVQIGNETTISLEQICHLTLYDANNEKIIFEYLHKKAAERIRYIVKNGIGKTIENDGICTITHYPPNRITKISVIFPNHIEA